MIFRQKAMLRTAIRPKRKVVAGRTLRNEVARRGYCGVPVNDFRASFPLPGMTLSVVLGRTPWRATRGSCTDCREYMPYRRLSARGRRRMCWRPQAGRCSPPHRAAAGCRSSATAENAYFLTESGCESVGNIPTFSSGISCKKIFTTFCHQKAAPTVSAGHLRRDRTAVLPERARKIYAVCAHPIRALEPPFDLFLPPVQCGGCCALRATMIIRLRPYMAGPRPARSHCFRYFSRCLIFWCFWIKPKAQEKLRKGENFPIDSSGRIPRFRRCIRRPFSFPDFSQGGAMGALRRHCLRYFSYL